jgi:hypothetical protein
MLALLMLLIEFMFEEIGVDNGVLIVFDELFRLETLILFFSLSLFFFFFISGISITV